MLFLSVKINSRLLYKQYNKKIGMISKNHPDLFVKSLVRAYSLKSTNRLYVKLKKKFYICTAFENESDNF